MTANAVFAILIIIWVVLMWGFVGYAIWRGWGPFVRSKRQRKVSLQARIADKRGSHEFDPVNWRQEFTQKVLVFECEDGVARDYEVHDDVWDWVEVGDEGVLTYQGELFVTSQSAIWRIRP